MYLIPGNGIPLCQQQGPIKGKVMKWEIKIFQNNLEEIRLEKALGS